MIHHPMPLLRAVALMGLTLVVAGCSPAQKEPVPERYANVGLRPLPAYLRGTVLEMADLGNTEAYPVSGYGLVVNLAGTGGNAGLPTSVREYMLDEMSRRGFGRLTGDDRYAKLKPERILDDPQKTTAVVTAEALIPPGARKSQRIDLLVRALPDTETSSLARGRLYRTALRIRGADPMMPRGSVNIYAIGEGDVFVNPALLMADTPAASGTAQASLRAGTVLGNTFVSENRPLWLRLRVPELRLARGIEGRVRLQFPKTEDDSVPRAQARDEGMLDLIVPMSFDGDWEHFAGVVMHLFLNATAEFASAKAMELTAEAVKPGAPLMDISYCWEGLGKPALQYLPPLYQHPAPDVAYAAARAGAFLGDSLAQQRLLEIAQQEGNPFQLAAVKSLGGLPTTPRIERLLGRLLDSSNTLARVEAYRILCRYPQQSRINSQNVRGSFLLDTVPSEGPPLVYASRVGMPRLVIFGKRPEVRLPIMFTALESALTISSPEDGRQVLKIYYRGKDVAAPVSALSNPDLRELVWRLGGGSDDGLRFSYADVVGVVQKLSERRDVAAAFVLQEMPRVRGVVDEAPVIPVRSIPTTGQAPPADEPSIGVRPQ